MESVIDEIANKINQINDFMDKYGEDNEPYQNIGMYCMKPYKCEYWEYCTRNIPKPNVFDIYGGMRLKDKLKKYNEGKISFEDLQYEKLNPRYLEQIDYEINKRQPKIEIESIMEVLNSLKYPLYFIDFETFQLAIHEYE